MIKQTPKGSPALVFKPPVWVDGGDKTEKGTRPALLDVDELLQELGEDHE